MTNPLARFIGIRVADASSGPRMPRPLFLLLTATITLFYVNNAAASPITSLLVTAKWLPMIALCLVAMNLLRDRRAPAVPMVAILPLAVLALVSLVGSLTGVEPARSVLALLSVVLAVIFGYLVSALIVATDSRRAFFELVGNIGRVMIVITTLFALARIDLGRGGGFGAWSDNPNTLALILIPGLIVYMAGCIERRPGWVFWHAAFLFVGSVLVWYTNARAALIWLGLSGLTFWVYRRGPAATSIAAMIFLVVLIGWWQPIRAFVVEELGLNWSIRNVGISPLSGREEAWRVGWHLFNQRYLQGYGFGTSQTLIKAEYWRFRQFQGGHFHSSYIEALVEVGLLGFLALMSLLGVTVARGIADASRTKLLPRESWPLAALPVAMIVGAMGHAIFESWLLAAGNANAPLFWTCLFMVFHQSGIPIRAVRRAPRPAAHRWDGRRALPTR